MDVNVVERLWMTGLMWRTCIIPACYGKYVQNWVSCIVYGKWRWFPYSSVKNEGKLFLYPTVSTHQLIKQDACIHNELHLKDRALMLSCALPCLIKQQTVNRNVNMTEMLLACLWENKGGRWDIDKLLFAKYYCSCICIQYIIIKAA